MKSRAYRRAQRERLLKLFYNRFKENWGSKQDNNPWAYGRYDPIPFWAKPAYLGKAVNTRQPCSCWECGNVPREYKGVTRQEVMNAWDALDDLQDLGYTESDAILKNFKMRYENPWSWD